MTPKPSGGLERVDQLAQAGALLALDLARDARVLGARQQHQVAAGQRVERGQRRRLVGELLLDDLHEDLFAGLEHILDARAPPLAAVAVLPRHRWRHGQVAETDLVERQERVALSADVDEGGFERGVDAMHDPLVDVSLEMLAAEGFDLERFENPVCNDPHPALFGVGDVDEHDLWHEYPSAPPPIRRCVDDAPATSCLVRCCVPARDGTRPRGLGSATRVRLSSSDSVTGSVRRDAVGQPPRAPTQPDPAGRSARGTTTARHRPRRSPPGS